jgi:hypothetical protein
LRANPQKSQAASQTFVIEKSQIAGSQRAKSGLMLALSTSDFSWPAGLLRAKLRDFQLKQLKDSSVPRGGEKSAFDRKHKRRVLAR